MASYLFSSESVTEGHPDKLCDAVSDAVLDACLAADPHSRVACETVAKTGFVMLAGEITTKAQLNILPKVFHIDIPEELSDAVEKCKDNAAVKEVGIEWCVQQSKELIKRNVPTMHFYSMGKSDPIYRIARELF